MEYGYSILMFAFSGSVLLYAGLIAMGNYDLIRRLRAAKVRDKKEYAKRFARVLALVSLSPFLSGIVGLLGDTDRMILPAGAVLVVSFIILLAIGTRIMKK